MAKSKIEGANGLDIIKKQLSSRQPSGIYLLTGEERYLIGVYVDRFKRLFEEFGFEEFNIIEFEGSSHKPDEVRSALDALPVMAEKKLIIFKDTGAFKLSPGALKPVWESLLDNPPDYAVVIFNESETDGRSGLLKKIKAKGIVAEFKFLKLNELVKWVMQDFSKDGKKISATDAEYLITNCEEGLGNIINEMHKLSSYIGNRNEVLRADIDAVVSRSVQNRLFDMVDAIIERKKDVSISLLYGLKELKEPSVRILAVLGQHIASLVKVKMLKGEPYEELAKHLKPAFMVKKYTAQASKVDTKFLNRALNKCCEVDFDIKTGNINDWIGLEMLVAYLLEG